MKKTKRLKRLYRKLQYYSPIIGIISIVLGVSFFTINYLGTQQLHQLAESWRAALSRSLEVILEGGKAHPFRTPNKWAVSFQQEPSVQVNFQASANVVLIKGSSTLEAQQANSTGN